MSDVEERLLIAAAAQVREAIDKRSERLADAIVEYDVAVRSGDDSRIKTGAAVLLVLVCSADPVQDVVMRYVQMSRLLAEVESQDA